MFAYHCGASDIRMSNAAKQVMSEYTIIAGPEATRSCSEILGSPESSCWRDLLLKYAAIAEYSTPYTTTRAEKKPGASQPSLWTSVGCRNSWQPALVVSRQSAASGCAQ